MSLTSRILREKAYRPRWWIDTVIPYAYGRLIEGCYSRFGPEGCSVMNEDWDNLVLLDGCRFDIFQELNTLNGSLESRISKGSATPEFLDENFTDGKFYDTVYVTANPMYRLRDLEETFYETIDVWDNHWDTDLKTVRPESMVATTRSAHERFPNKRIFSHFMQPHYPFIGESGQTIEHSGYELAFRNVQGDEVSRDAPTVWDLLREGAVSRREVWRAYRENLELVLSHVETLVDDLTGRTVVTSDHGNMLGEFIFPFPKRIYGHPRGIHAEELVKVPWLVIERETRKDVIAESSGDPVDHEVSEEVSERLSDLGYADL